MNKSGLLFFLHKWCGLILAVLLVLQAATGLAISFRNEVTALLYPGGSQVVSTADLAGAVVTWADRTHPAMELERIHFYDTVALARLVSPSSDWPVMALFDRDSARLIRSAPLQYFPLEMAARLHYSLVGGEVGALVIGVEGLLLAAMVITGVILWWPARGRWRRALTLRASLRGTALWIQLHKVVGAWLGVVLLVVGLTGAILIFEDFIKPVVNRVAPVSELEMPALRAFDGRLARGGYGPSMELVEHTFPGETLRQLRFVGENHRALVAILHNYRGQREQALNFAVVDRAYNSLAAEVRADDAPSGERFFQMIMPLHSGHIAGLAGRVVNVLGGLVIVIMAASGVLIWSRRRRTRAARVAGSPVSYR